jgi:Ca2+-binding RTX toxin-like protein
VRRTVSLLLVAMVMVLVMPGGVALAVTASCTVIRPCKGTEGPDTIVSTDDRADEILTLGGEDVVVLLGDGEDRVRGAAGDDVLIAAGDDRLRRGSGAETVYGGGGNDTCVGDPDDVLIGCEVRQQ